MYAKIFEQIFDSSIAENYELRHFFEDMLKLADPTGVVDITAEAIGRRINLPIEKVKAGLDELMKPDPRSRSHEHDGRRLIPLDSHRDWGWIIVNYVHYRAVRDEVTRRIYFRDAKRRQRAAKAARNGGRFTKVQQAQVRAKNDGLQKQYEEADINGDTRRTDEIAAEGLPNGL